MSSATPQLSQQDLRSVALYQKIILLWVLVYLLTVFAQFVIPAELRSLLGIALVGIGVVAAVFVFLLSLKIFSTGTGIVLAILTLIPIIGLIALLVINQKATTILKNKGYKVGLLGADLSEFKH
jgi:hypothetical protein